MDLSELSNIVAELDEMAGQDKILARNMLLSHERLIDLDLDEYEFVLDRLLNSGIRIVDTAAEVDGSVKRSGNFASRATSKRRRGPRGQLIVKFPDGKIYQGKSSTDTFVKAIEDIGVERVRRLGLYCCDIHLISEKATERYAHAQKFCNGYFIFTHSGTDRKKEILDRISNLLGLGLSIEVVEGNREKKESSSDIENFEEPIVLFEKKHDNSLQGGELKKKPKTNLVVTLPNGTVLRSKKALDTFVETIKFLGVEKVRALGLEFSKIPLVAERTTPRYASAQKFCDGFYIFTYNSTEKKKAILEEISSKLDVVIIVQVVSDYSRSILEILPIKNLSDLDDA